MKTQDEIPGAASHRRSVEMPTISAHRRALTPTLSGPSASATATSPLFQRIPPEIRRMILIYAFGDQTMHLDLRRAYPRHSSGPFPCSGPTHANRNSRARNRFGDEPMRWEWSGSVCHRSLIRSDAPVLDPRAIPPSDDGCHDTHPAKHLCHLWPGSVPEKCFVGALGWLRACRQAYVEGVEVLYGTNVFHFRGTDFLQRLPRVLVRERLDTIRAVELAWDMAPWTGLPEEYAHWTEWRPCADMDGFQSALDALPGILPNLRFMYLSLQGYFFLPEGIEYEGEKHAQMTEDMLVRVEGMLRNMRRLEDCRVELPWSVFRLKVERTVEEGWETYERAMWRDLLPKEDAVGRIAGYWICKGVDDSEAMQFY